MIEKGQQQTSTCLGPSATACVCVRACLCVHAQKKMWKNYYSYVTKGSTCMCIYKTRRLINIDTNMKLIDFLHKVCGPLDETGPK